VFKLQHGAIQPMSNEPASTIITLLRSTSVLLEHYGYSEHDPTLSELQFILQRAVARLEATERPSDEWCILPAGSRLQ
jgi:hypothetical protein